jgi:membrane associated rhomboid family serine protease
VAAFIYQVHQNALDNPYDLVMVGALYSPLLENGEWWRLVSAQFVHWGMSHLFFNMLGLWFLGPRVESLLGPLRFLLAYLICGAGGMLIAWGCATVFQQDSTIILLGASASVLGLVGLQAALALKTFRYTGSLGAKAQLTAMTQIIILQAIFDFMVPQVSSTAHVGGAAVGFALGMAFMRPKGMIGEVV